MTRLVLPLLAVLACAMAGGAGTATNIGLLTFYPQAGVLGQDLFVNNFVDLDPGPGVRDYACGSQTYDGHNGLDSDIRSFREMDIGVPVFAALDGKVISVQDGFFDREHGRTTSRFDNHVVLEHGPGRFTIYGHLRKGIELRRGYRVVAGQQIGWTASSGNSTWPHLHFTYKVDGEVTEPFAGPCRPGPSHWVTQPAFSSAPYARDLAISARPFHGRALPPYDEAVRTGTFVRGVRVVHLRLELAALSPSSTLRVRIVRPDGTPALDRRPPVRFGAGHGRGEAYLAYRMRFDVAGRWRLEIDVDGQQVARSPIRVVQTLAQMRNRPPNPVSAALIPAEPAAADVVLCRLTTSLVTEDPDYDVVAYRYRWTVGGRRVRSVTSAALSDVARRGIASPGSRITCSVTPWDGRLAGPTATASGTIRR